MRRILATLAVLLAAPSVASAHPLVFGPRHAQARVIVLHGLNGTPETLLTAPYVTLIRKLSRHYQVIDAPEPYDTRANQALALESWFNSDRLGLGYGYRLRWMREFRHLVAWADRTYGIKRLMVAGISWGGMHAILAACYDPQVSAFSVSSPVVNPDALTEFSTDTLRALDPNTNGCARRLNKISGFIGWGDADVRVGTVAVQRLLRNAPRINGCRYHNLGHTSDALTETNMVRALREERILGCWPTRTTAPAPTVSGSAPSRLPLRRR